MDSYNNYLNDEEVVATENKFLQKYNNIYISIEQKEILDKYGFDINKYSSVNELLFDLEEYLNDSYTELEDLEWVSQTVAEYNYYNNTNK